MLNPLTSMLHEYDSQGRLVENGRVRPLQMMGGPPANPGGAARAPAPTNRRRSNSRRGRGRRDSRGRGGRRGASPPGGSKGGTKGSANGMGGAGTFGMTMMPGGTAPMGLGNFAGGVNNFGPMSSPEGTTGGVGGGGAVSGVGGGGGGGAASLMNPLLAAQQNLLRTQQMNFGFSHAVVGSAGPMAKEMISNIASNFAQSTLAQHAAQGTALAPNTLAQSTLAEQQGPKQHRTTNIPAGVFTNPAPLEPVETTEGMMGTGVPPYNSTTVLETTTTTFSKAASKAASNQTGTFSKAASKAAAPFSKAAAPPPPPGGTALAPSPSNHDPPTTAVPPPGGVVSKRTHKNGQWVCLVCKRGFKTVEMIERHEKESELHAENVRKMAAAGAAGAK